MMHRRGSRAAWLLGVMFATSVLAGCASAPPPAPGPIVRPLEGVQRVVVVASGDSKFAGMPSGKEDTDRNRVFEEVMKWLPYYKPMLVPIARAVYWGLNWLMESQRGTAPVPKDVTPGAVVASAFARTLQGLGPFDEVVTMEHEPAGDARRAADAIVRVTVPSWGLVNVREGTPRLVAGFADVRAQMVLRETGAVLWEHEEDVTHPDRLSLDAVTRDTALARERLMEVLERAGRRLASELVYSRGAAQ